MRERPAWRRYLQLLGSNPDADVEDEIQFHLAKRVEDLVGEGLSEAAARNRAAREFGNMSQIRRELHQIGQRRLQREARAGWWESLVQDIRFAARTLRKSLGFTGVVVCTLALGIGGTTTMFSVVQAVLLAPLPYASPGQLVRLYQQEPQDPSTRSYLSAPHLRDVFEHADAFEHVAAVYTYRETGLDLVAAGAPQRLRVLEVTDDYFNVLRAGALRGRGFARDDAGRARRVVLSDALWHARFGGDQSILGTTLSLSGEPYEVVGIAPQGLEDPIAGKVDAWLPYDLTKGTDPANYSLSAIARLRTGVTIDQAYAELASLSRALAERWPGVRASAIVAVPLKDDIVASSRGPLRLLLIAVGLLLVVSCVNVANLFLVRSTGRVRELSIRAALGAGRMRIARQLLAESLLLATLGGVGGLALAAMGLDALRALGGDSLPRLGEARLDPVVLGFAALTTFVTGIAFGMTPAVRYARVDSDGALREHARSVTSAGRHGRLRSGLAAAQLALALTLLTGAGVLIASFVRLQGVPLGFRVDGVLTFDVSLPAARYDAERRAIVQEQMAHEIASIPGVIAAGGTSRLPATGSYHSWSTRIDSGPLAGTPSTVPPEQRVVSGRFFEALAIPVLAGRTFDARDDVGAPRRAVVSADFARVAFPGMPLAEVVGQRITAAGEAREIVGVVGDVKLDVRGTSAPVVYHAHRQFAADRNWALTQVVASELPPDQLLGAVRTAVAALDPQLVIYRTAPMTDVTGRGVRRERLALVLMGTFAAIALMLAALGLYGVLAYAVHQRTREIGIRIALGATLAHVRALVLRQAAQVLAIGAITGLAGALLLGRWMSSLTFDIDPWDGRVLVTTTLLLGIVGLLAAWLPTRRATSVDPKIAMLED